MYDFHICIITMKYITNAFNKYILGHINLLISNFLCLYNADYFTLYSKWRYLIDIKSSNTAYNQDLMKEPKVCKSTNEKICFKRYGVASLFKKFYAIFNLENILKTLGGRNYLAKKIIGLSVFISFEI